VREVSNYVAGLDYGMRRLSEGFPLSTRLLREIHQILLADGRGSGRFPGEFRKGQVWIGGATPETASFVPPPWQEVEDALGHLERFLHDEPVRTPALLKAGLAHAQFETIHPFMDGNGRLGRLLITLLLCEEKALSAPILYLSLFLKGNRLEYYERLQRIRTHGDWEGWIRFFLRGVRETADHALETTRRILALFEADRTKLQGLGQAAASALRVHERMQHKPILRLNELATALSLSYPTIAGAMDRMVGLGIAKELTGYARNRVFAYAPYISILAEGADPLPAP
jgi:Fic family protein